MQQVVVAWIDGSPKARIGLLHDDNSIEIACVGINQGDIISIKPITEPDCQDFFVTEQCKAVVKEVNGNKIKYQVVSEEKSSDILETIQNHVPQANQFLLSYNLGLAQKILHNTNHAELIIQVNGVLYSEAVQLLDNSEKINNTGSKIVFQLNTQSRLHEYLKYNRNVRLLMKKDQLSYYFTGWVDKIFENSAEVVLDEFSHHKQGPLETYRYKSQVSVFKRNLVLLQLKIKYWSQFLRLHFFVFTMLPILLGFVYSSQRNGFEWFAALGVLIGFSLIQLGGVLISDYFDHVNNIDEINLNINTGAPRFIQRGLVHPAETFWLGMSMLAIGSVIGLFLNYYAQGNTLLAIGLVGAMTAYFYTGKPLELAYRGLGELLLGFTFGPLVFVGTVYVMTSSIVGLREILLYSLPSAIIIVSLMLVNSIKDITADQTSEKYTLAVRLGEKRSKGLIVFLLVLMYVSHMLIVQELSKLMWPMVSGVIAAKIVYDILKTGISNQNFRHFNFWLGVLHLTWVVLFIFSIL